MVQTGLGMDNRRKEAEVIAFEVNAVVQFVEEVNNYVDIFENAFPESVAQLDKKFRKKLQTLDLKFKDLNIKCKNLARKIADESETKEAKAEAFKDLEVLADLIIRFADLDEVHTYLENFISLVNECSNISFDQEAPLKISPANAKLLSNLETCAALAQHESKVLQRITMLRKGRIWGDKSKANVFAEAEALAQAYERAQLDWSDEIEDELNKASDNLDESFFSLVGELVNDIDRVQSIRLAVINQDKRKEKLAYKKACLRIFCEACAEVKLTLSLTEEDRKKLLVLSIDDFNKSFIGLKKKMKTQNNEVGDVIDDKLDALRILYGDFLNDLARQSQADDEESRPFKKIKKMLSAFGSGFDLEEIKPDVNDDVLPVASDSSSDFIISKAESDFVMKLNGRHNQHIKAYEENTKRTKEEVSKAVAQMKRDWEEHPRKNKIEESKSFEEAQNESSILDVINNLRENLFLALEECVVSLDQNDWWIIFDMCEAVKDFESLKELSEKLTDYCKAHEDIPESLLEVDKKLQAYISSLEYGLGQGRKLKELKDDTVNFSSVIKEALFLFRLDEGFSTDLKDFIEEQNALDNAEKEQLFKILTKEASERFSGVKNLGEKLSALQERYRQFSSEESLDVKLVKYMDIYRECLLLKGNIKASKADPFVFYLKNKINEAINNLQEEIIQLKCKKAEEESGRALFSGKHNVLQEDWSTTFAEINMQEFFLLCENKIKKSTKKISSVKDKLHVLDLLVCLRLNQSNFSLELLHDLMLKLKQFRKNKLDTETALIVENAIFYVDFMEQFYDTESGRNCNYKSNVKKEGEQEEDDLEVLLSRTLAGLNRYERVETLKIRVQGKVDQRVLLDQDSQTFNKILSQEADKFKDKFSEHSVLFHDCYQQFFESVVKDEVELSRYFLDKFLKALKDEIKKGKIDSKSEYYQWQLCCAIALFLKKIDSTDKLKIEIINANYKKFILCYQSLYDENGDAIILDQKTFQDEFKKCANTLIALSNEPEIQSESFRWLFSFMITTLWHRKGDKQYEKTDLQEMLMICLDLKGIIASQDDEWGNYFNMQLDTVILDLENEIAPNARQTLRDACRNYLISINLEENAILYNQAVRSQQETIVKNIQNDLADGKSICSVILQLKQSQGVLEQNRDSAFMTFLKIVGVVAGTIFGFVGGYFAYQSFFGQQAVDKRRKPVEEMQQSVESLPSRKRKRG